jgi:DNA-binding NtrC family response regulator
MSYGTAERATGEGALVTEAQLVLAMDCAAPASRPARFALADIEEVLLSRGSERKAVRRRDNDRGILQIWLPDAWMSSSHTRLMRMPRAWTGEDAGSKNGTYVNGRRISRTLLSDGDLITTGNTLLRFRAATEVPKSAVADLDADALAGLPAAFATLDPALGREFEALAKIAVADVPVLITGETGTGKEVTARAIHDQSRRRGSFTAVNCGAIPDTLIESELFGARKGAYSGATQDRDGLVRASSGGTLFLDEVAELPESSQAALLRVLQERQVIPVGETRPVAVDIRVVAATHQDLPARVAAGTFRHDLYARLIGYQFHLPPLRERRDDIGNLVAELLTRLDPERAPRIQLKRDAGRALFAYGWPMNVRELEHALSSALAVIDGDVIGVDDLPEAVGDAVDDDRPHNAPTTVTPELMRANLVELARELKGNLSELARRLRTSRSQARRLLKRHGIDWATFRS